MPGFFVGNIEHGVLINEFNDRCIQEQTIIDELFFARNTLDRFLLDKPFYGNDEYALIIEGVLLNKHELLVRFNASSVEELAISLYKLEGDAFFRHFRGPFSGAFLDRQNEKLIVYTNHMGDNAVFYHVDTNGHFAFGSQVNYIASALRAKGIKEELDEAAVLQMLTYGFMIDDSTFISQIKRLLPGCYAVLQLKDRSWSLHSYYRPKGHKVSLDGWSREEILEQVDRLFVQAVRREFDKDREYGYRHLCDLSGGLDSRMTTWVAHEQGYEDCLNLTYCQAGYADQIIAEQIAADLGNEFLFKSLDDASFIYEPDRIVRMNNGLALYAGITGGESLLRMLDISQFGLEHTGQAGDVVISSCIDDIAQLHSIEHIGAYSSKLLDFVASPDPKAFIDQEQFFFEARVWLGALSTHMIRNNYTVAVSPFLDVDLLDFCLSIPAEMRLRHRFYKEWIQKMHPGAAKYVWEKEGCRIDAQPLSRVAAKGIRGLRSMMLLLRGRGGGRSRLASMNPFEYWYATDKELREWIDAKVEDAIESVPASLSDHLIFLRNDASVLEKIQIITVGAAIKCYVTGE